MCKHIKDTVLSSQTAADEKLFIENSYKSFFLIFFTDWTLRMTHGKI